MRLSFPFNVAVLVGLMAGTAAGWDYGLAYDTGAVHADTGYPELQVNVPTPLTISMVNYTDADYAIPGITFEFSAPWGGLAWDLDGPDDTGFTPDDGFSWEPWLDGSPHPVFGTNDYFATIDPPQTGFLSWADLFAVTIPAGGSGPVATLVLEGTEFGTFRLAAGDEAGIFHLKCPLCPVEPRELGTQIVVAPEAATLCLLAIGGLAMARRLSASNAHKGV